MQYTSRSEAHLQTHSSVFTVQAITSEIFTTFFSLSCWDYTIFTAHNRTTHIASTLFTAYVTHSLFTLNSATDWSMVHLAILHDFWGI